MALHWKILIGMVIGSLLGLSLNLLGQGDLEYGTRLQWWMDTVVQPLGQVFLRLIIMVVIPLVFSSLALGVQEIGAGSRLGKIGLLTLLFTVIFSVLAVLIGVTSVNLFQPGGGLSEESRTKLESQYSQASEKAVTQSKQAKAVQQILLDVIPENPLQEAVGALDGSSKGNGMLAIMFCALLTGLAIATNRPAYQAVIDLLENVQSLTMKIISWAMMLSPFAVGLLMCSMTARMGFQVFSLLLGFVLTVLLGLALQLFVVYSLVLWLCGYSPIRFFQRAAEALFTAFGTSSSNATLPTAIRVATEKLGLRSEIARFVLTIGATGNQNGTALFEGVVVLFLAQVYNVELTLMQQIQVVLMSILAGVGTAGVPGGSLPMIIVVMGSVGVPPSGIALIMGVDRLLDMSRTTINVAGDLAIATCVSQLSPAEKSPETKVELEARI